MNRGGEAFPNGTMRAWRLHRLGDFTAESPPFELETLPLPSPDRGELLLRVRACGVCHTELDEIEGRAPPPSLPVVPGHQVVGEVVEEGPGCTLGLAGRRVGVAWIHSACGACRFCREGRENLCAGFKGCGKEADGGYAEAMTVPEAFAHPLPGELDDLAVAPLLCAGAVGYRALSLCGLTGDEPLGLTGFGASGHLVLQMARALRPNAPVLVFARNPRERTLALDLGAAWAGDTCDSPPIAPSAIIDTTPAWKPVLAALAVLPPGGRLVINAIAKESGDLDQWLGLDYQRHLWREKQLKSVTNVTRDDVRACLDLAAAAGIRPEVTPWPFEQANEALADLRAGGEPGARVLVLP
jgi:propanol-preferring alcohol dehydrogenase